MTITEPDLERRWEELNARLARIEAAATAPDPRAVVAPGGHIPDVVDGQIIESAWGNEIRNRAVGHYATKADLLAAWPAATGPLGAMAVTLDTGTVWELTDRSGVRLWAPPWSTAWGFLALAQYNGDFAFTTQIDIPGLTVTYGQVKGRLYRTTLDINTYGTVVGTFEVLICQGDNSVMTHLPALSGTAQAVEHSSLTQWESASVSASVTRKARAVVNGAMTGHVYAAAGYTATLVAEDIGPSAPVAP